MIGHKRLTAKAVTLLKKGDLVEAKIIFNRLIKNGLGEAHTYNYLGTIYIFEMEWEKCIRALQIAISIDSNYVEAIINLGIALEKSGQIKDAITSYKKVLNLEKNNIAALTNLGIALEHSGDIKGAIKYIKEATLIKTQDPNLICNLGHCYQLDGNYKESINVYNKALEIDPFHYRSINNLSSVYIQKGGLREAKLLLKKCLAINPRYAEAFYHLGLVEQLQGSYYEAIDAYQKALNIESNYGEAIASLFECKGRICDWSLVDNYKQKYTEIDFSGKAIPPLGVLIYDDNPYSQMIRAKRFFEKEFKRLEIEGIKLYKKKKIRICYFSANFYNHPVMQLIARLFELHDKNTFEVYGYSFGLQKKDAYRNRIENSLDVFKEVDHLDDSEIALLARKDKIDIAIDLMGHTKDSRLGIFSYRAAPIQINYLGYPGTNGDSCFDYIIADDVLIKKEERKYYQEEVITLPGSYQCNDDTKTISKKLFNRNELGIPLNTFVFTCFNENYKITKSEFSAWMNILKRVEMSVLWLYSSNQISESNLKKEAAKAGVDSGRIIFGERMNNDDHLARHSCGDLFLDTFNYGAHTTASDALWSGMPLLTLTGKSFSSRVAESLLRALEMEELICNKIEEYEDKAIEIATKRDLFIKIREKLSQKIKESGLYNSKNFSKNFEEILKKVYKQYINYKANNIILEV